MDVLTQLIMEVCGQIGKDEAELGELLEALDVHMTAVTRNADGPSEMSTSDREQLILRLVENTKVLISEIEQLKVSAQELSSQNKTLEDAHITLMGNNEALDRRLSEVMEINSLRSDQLSCFTSRLYSLQNSIKRLVKAIDEREPQGEPLGDRRDQNDITVVHLQAENAMLRESSLKQQKALEEMSSLLNSVKNDNGNLSKAISSTMDALADSKTSLQVKQAAEEKVREELSKVKSELRDALLRNKILHRQIATFRSQERRLKVPGVEPLYAEDHVMTSHRAKTLSVLSPTSKSRKVNFLNSAVQDAPIDQPLHVPFCKTTNVTPYADPDDLCLPEKEWLSKTFGTHDHAGQRSQTDRHSMEMRISLLESEVLTSLRSRSSTKQENIKIKSILHDYDRQLQVLRDDVESARSTWKDTYTLSSLYPSSRPSGTSPAKNPDRPSPVMRISPSIMLASAVSPRRINADTVVKTGSSLMLPTSFL